MAITNWTIWKWLAAAYLRLRKKWTAWCTPALSSALADSLQSCGAGFHIYPPFDVAGNGKIEIGSNVHINSYAWIRGYGGLRIGNNVHIGPHLTIYSHSHNYQGEALPYDAGVIEKPVTICDNVWIGACVTIVPGVTIGEGAVIAAGTVVSKDVPPLEVVGSQSARTLKTRDREHYYRLRSARKFGDVGGQVFHDPNYSVDDGDEETSESI